MLLGLHHAFYLKLVLLSRLGFQQDLRGARNAIGYIAVRTTHSAFSSAVREAVIAMQPGETQFPT